MVFGRAHKKKKILLIQGSLSPFTKTAVLIHETAACLKRRGVDHAVLDMRTLDIDIWNNRSIQTYTPDTQKAYALMAEATAYLFAVPVYAHSVSGAIKNIVDIAAPIMKGKSTGILCYSDTTHSYSASLDFMRTLSRKAHATTLKPVIHTYLEDFKGDSIYTEGIYQLIEELVDSAIR